MAPRGPRFIHEFVRGSNFTAPDCLTAPRADVIVELLVRQNEQKLFPHRHRADTPRTVKARCAKTLELTRTHPWASIVCNNSMATRSGVCVASISFRRSEP